MAALHTVYRLPRVPRLTRSTVLLPRTVLALSLVFSAGAYAMGGAPAADRTWERTASEAPASTLTRAEVRESLANARNADLMPGVSDIGDTTAMLARRDIFYALQTEVMQAELDRESNRHASMTSDVAGARSRAASDIQAYLELRAAGAHPAMLRPSADGTVFTDARGRETLVVEIDD